MLPYKNYLLLIVLSLNLQIGFGQEKVEAIQASYDFGSGNGTFSFGKPLVIRFQLKNNTPRTLKGFVAGSISNEAKRIVHSYEKYLELLPGQSKTAEFTYQASQAGLYKIFTRYRNSLGSMAAQSIQVIYAPERINPPSSRKKDFEAFWKSSLKILDAIPPNFKVIPKSELSTEKYEVYLIEMQSYGKALIRAWYRVPTRPGRHPAILQLPSLGGSFFNVRSLKEKPRHGIPYDFAVLSLNIRGHGNSKEDLDLGENYKKLIAHRLESREEYFYRGALLDCIRALDFLSTRPEIDHSRIAVEGGSQGGALSLMTAALDRRVRLCAPDVPFLSDMDELFVQAPWVKKTCMDYQRKHPELSLWRMQYNLSYFDTKNFAGMIKVPVLMSLGLQDLTCPAITGLATYNKIQSPKECHIYPLARHEGGAEVHRRLKFAWIRRYFGMK